jgi:osmoprotectant transport system permease protein
VTVGGFVGLGGFGDFIDEGLTRDFPTLIVVGVIGSVLLALAADATLVAIGHLASPWRRPRGSSLDAAEAAT